MSIGYVTLGTNNPAASKAFYGAVMDVLGGTLKADYEDAAFCYALPDGGDIWVTRPINKEAASFGNGTTIAIINDSEAKVNAAHAAALAAGGTCEGEPGPRPDYGPEFYAAYARDLDGNKLAFVHYRTV